MELKINLYGIDECHTTIVTLPVASVKSLTDSWKSQGYYSNCPHLGDSMFMLVFGNNLTLPEINRLLKCLVKNAKRINKPTETVLRELNGRFHMIEEHYNYRVNVNEACTIMNHMTWNDDYKTLSFLKQTSC